MIIYSTAILSILIIYATGKEFSEYVNNVTSDIEVRGSKILSRRKRFLIFPEGSSLQLVFCNTFPSINVIGDIILFGYTAALAYELPQDPYSPFDHKADPLHRRVDSKEIYYLDEDGKVIYKRPYSTKFIVNPAFAKRSVDSPTARTDLKKEQFQIDRKQMHSLASKREFLNGDRMDRRSVEFHRTSRVLLYRKIETLLQGLGGNGKECLLKTLCLVGQTQRRAQGTFFQEILRAVFTLPKGETDDEDVQEYENAHLSTESCENLYPDCVNPLNDPVSANVL
ncbi:DM4/DM12 family domain-containing protein [Phthorimaea operculella]|nr:DM4/DM12 family domain-containing protein [Phthorimaea operculella]